MIGFFGPPKEDKVRENTMVVGLFAGGALGGFVGYRMFGLIGGFIGVAAGAVGGAMGGYVISDKIKRILDLEKATRAPGLFPDHCEEVR